MAKPTTITAKEVVHETGNVWQASFKPLPSEEILADFDWVVVDANDQALPFEAYSMRKLIDADGGGRLAIRFRDRGWTLQGPSAKLSARLRHPSL